MRGNGGVKLTSRTASLLVILLDGVGRLIEEREIVGLMGIEEKEKVRFYMRSAAFCLVIGKCYRGYISYIIFVVERHPLATPGLLRAPTADLATNQLPHLMFSLCKSLFEQLSGPFVGIWNF
jgi:hypothetical protein